MGPGPRMPAVTPEAARQQLERILLDPLFRQAGRLSVLLRFLVEATMAGRQSELKEFVIGAEAFERGPDFDPQLDNVVRVNAARLRSRLAEYYLGSGASDPVLITLPKGGYVPNFAAAETRTQPGRIAGAPTVRAGTAVGRHSELDGLRTEFELVERGSSRIVAISGEVGIGKTTLIDVFLAELRERPLPPWILRGQCSERLSKTEAFLPAFECLEDLMMGSRGAEVRRLMERTAPSWLSRLEPSTDSSGVEPSAERFRRELFRLLRALSETQPVVLFLDDVHWVDTSTVELLSYISSHFEGLRLMLLTAYRPSAVISAHAFLALKLTLERRRVCGGLSLGYLSPADVQTYVGQYLPQHELPVEFAAAVHERTDGNPLFMCEMLRFLVDQGIVAQDSGKWRLRCDIAALRQLIPAGVQNMIRLEIAQLADPDRRILECAAVQGVNFHSWVISKALEFDVVETEERLGRLAAQHHFIEYSGELDERGRPVSVRFRFLHVLYQNALYADIGPSRRVALSRSVATALVASGGDSAPGSPTELAMLFEQGRAYEEAASHFLRAARRAVYDFAYPEAVLLCRRGLENLNLVPKSPARDARELGFSVILGLALMVTRGYADPEVERVHLRSRELCVLLNDQRALVPVLWGLHTCLANAGELVPALELAEELRRVAAARKDAEPSIQSLHALGTTLAFMGRAADARAALEEAQHLLETTGLQARRALYILDPAVTLLSMLARVLARLGLREEALERARKSLEIATGLEHAPSIAYALFWMGWVHHAREEFSTACGILETAIDLSRKYGLPQFIEWGRILRGSSLAHLGRLSEGIAEMRASLENQLAMRCMLERPFCLTQLAEALLASGAHEEALRCCDEALEISQRTQAKSYEAETLKLREKALRGCNRSLLL